MNQFLFALLTGVTTGGFSCFAIQGGLLTSAIAGNPAKKLNTTHAFFISKVIAITILGALLGAAGDKVSITPRFQGYMQLVAGVFMILTALRLMDIHPIFRKFQIAPPKWAFRLVRSVSRDDSLFAPSLLGLSTVLIPCGITQSMMILAVASASAFSGAAIMFAYTVGTAPVFYTLGLASSLLLKKKSFVYFASAIILFFGLTAINTGQVLRGSVHTFQNYYTAAFKPNALKGSGNVAGLNNGVQEVTINVLSNGYRSDVTTLKKDVPVLLTLETQNTKGCSRAFTIPSLNLSKILPETGTETIAFTPTESGKLSFTCSMGMYSGFFNVI